jgi:spore coat protein U-like protein
LQIFLTIFVNDTVTAPIRTDHLRPAANPTEPTRVRNIYIFLLNGKVDRFSHVLACQVQMSGHSDYGTFPKRLADVFTTRQRKETPDMRTLSLALVSFILLAGSALAATQDLTVSAQVVGTCRFERATDIDFGDLDQTATTDETATGSLVFWCTKNANYILGDEANSAVGDGSFSGELAKGSEKIAYSLSYDNHSGNGAGKTSPITSTITATILNADYVNVPAGKYNDTVTFTLTP